MAPQSDKPFTEFSFRTREADWTYLKNNPDHLHNVTIIGGGIVGAGILRELSLRGVSGCYLFDKKDFASGTSGASSKLIHAGIRYLEQSWERLKKGQIVEAWRNFIYVVQASNERRVLGDIAPHLIKPKPFYFLLSEGNHRSVMSVCLGIWFYYLLQLIQGQFFRPPKTVYRKEAMKWIAPHLDSQKIKAIFSFWDSETDDARLVIENLQSAYEHGGHALNYVELIEYEKNKNEIVLTLKNNENNDSIKIRTKIFINASGPFIDEVNAKRRGEKRRLDKLVDRVAGAHLNIYPAITGESYYITAQDNRLVFVLLRNEDGLVYNRVGTTERPLATKELSDWPTATPVEIDYLKTLVSEFFPQARIDENSLISTDAGIRPLLSQESHSPFQKSREHRIVDEEGVFHVVGVKLTDYRRVSTELFNLIPWGKYEIHPASDDARADFLLLRKSSSKWIYEENDLDEIVRRTMVLHWDDYVFRRRGLRPQVTKKMDPEKLKGEFDLLAEILCWNNERKVQEAARIAS